MIELTKDQANILTEMANGRAFFATFGSVEADGKAAATIDRVFAESMQLVEYGLCFDLTTLPKFKSLVSEYKKTEGRDISILGASELVKRMFRRVPWQKQVN